MKHLFIPYELAVIAKEKGFNEQCIGLYSEKLGFRFTHDVTMDFNRSNSELEHPLIAAPLYQQIVDWFREKQIHIYENPIVENYWSVMRGGKVVAHTTPLDKAIEEAFKLI